MHRHVASDPRCLWCRLARLDATLWQDRLTRYGLIVLTILVGLLIDRLLWLAAS